MTERREFLGTLAAVPPSATKDGPWDGTWLEQSLWWWRWASRRSAAAPTCTREREVHA